MSKVQDYCYCSKCKMRIMRPWFKAFFLCVGENIFFYFVKFYIYILIIIFNHTSSSDLKTKKNKKRSAQEPFSGRKLLLTVIKSLSDSHMHLSTATEHKMATSDMK